MITHEEFLRDLKTGLYNEFPELEYIIISHEHERYGSIVQLELYDPNEIHNAFLSSYQYYDSCDAREDMEEITRDFGIEFKEMNTDVFCEEIPDEEEN